MHVLPLVSVVVSTYNRASYLEAALTSVEAQTYPSREVIVVDDGSSDHTAEVVRGYSGEIRYVHQPNLGRSEARNSGIRASSGQLIAFLDDDDLWHPTKLQRQVEVLATRPEVGLVHTFTEVIDAAGRPLPAETNKRFADHSSALAEGYTFEAMTEVCTMFLSSVMIRRSCFERVGLFDPAIPALEDWDLYLRIARDFEIATIAEALTSYRVHGGNSPQAEHVEGRIKTALKHLNELNGVEAPGFPTARHNLQVHLGTAHYMAGDFPACRRWTMDAFRTRPLATAKSRLPLHVLLTLLPEGVLDMLRETKRSAAS